MTGLEAEERRRFVGQRVPRVNDRKLLTGLVFHPLS